MGVTTWETSFVVYTELRLDAYESNATRGVIKMITHAATGRVQQVGQREPLKQKLFQQHRKTYQRR